MSGTEERIAALRFSTHSLNPRKLDDEMPRRSTVSNRYKPMHACDRKKLTLAFSSTHLLSCVLWLNDTSYSKSVWRRNRNVPAKNTLVQLLALYTNCESQNAQRHRQTDRRTDRRQDYANSRSYCVAVLPMIARLSCYRIFCLTLRYVDKHLQSVNRTHLFVVYNRRCIVLINWVSRPKV